MQTKTGSLYINPWTLVFLLSSLMIFWMMLYLPLPFYHHAFSLAMGERPPHPSPCAKIVVKHGGYYYRSFKSSSSLYILFKGGMFEFPVLTDPQDPEEVYIHTKKREPLTTGSLEGLLMISFFGLFYRQGKSSTCSHSRCTRRSWRVDPISRRLFYTVVAGECSRPGTFTHLFYSIGIALLCTYKGIVDLQQGLGGWE